MSDYLLIKLL